MNVRKSDISGTCNELWKMCKCDRILQTLSVVSYLAIAYGYTSLVGFLTFLCCFFSPFFLFAFGYAYWYYSTIDHPFKGGYNFKFLKNLPIWKYFRDYFPIRLHKTADIDASRNYIFAVHPTGILNAGAMSFFGTGSTDFDRNFPGITPHLLTHKAQFYFPLTRELLLFSGAGADDRRSMEWVLNNRGLWSKKGQACVLTVADNDEILEQKPGRITLAIKSRKDFIRASLQTGASIVPVFAFGEHNVYEVTPSKPGSLLRSIQEKVRGCTNIPFPLISGRGVTRHSFGFLPLRRPVDVVVGKPIDVHKVEHPTHEQINQVFETYQKEIENLFNEHKGKYLQDKNTVLQFK